MTDKAREYAVPLPTIRSTRDIWGQPIKDACLLAEVLSMRDKMQDVIDFYRAELDKWLKENRPKGWIDNIRIELAAERAKTAKATKRAELAEYQAEERRKQVTNAMTSAHDLAASARSKALREAADTVHRVRELARDDEFDVGFEAARKRM